MDERVVRLKTSKDALVFAANAKRLGNIILESEALSRSIELKANEEGFFTPAEKAIAEALYAYEDEQSKIKGRKFHASRTRKMLKDHTPLIAAEKMVLSPRPSQGYAVLEETGRQDLSFEAIVVRYPDEFSGEAIAAAHARLAGEKYVPIRAPRGTLQVVPLDRAAGPDPEAQRFFREFRNPETWFVTRWLPQYRETTDTIGKALRLRDPDSVFELIWKTQDNSVSNAGRGVMGFDAVERLRDRLGEFTQKIALDSSPDNFDAIVREVESWRDSGEIHSVPRLLIARAFAAIHPDRYHTTVDSAKQDKIIPWFVQHTGFVAPADESWAVKADALVTHLSSLNQFDGDMLTRNIFPWFVFDQSRDFSGQVPFKSGHTPRSDGTDFDVSSRHQSISLRHNVLQTELYRLLCIEFGEDSVRTEHPTGAGTYADALVRTEGGSCFLYEIKVANTAADAVREAMGQLLEYAYRPGGFEPQRLIVVAESPLDSDTDEFIKRMRSRFNLNLEYFHLVLP